jgi:hypothetical protein
LSACTAAALLDSLRSRSTPGTCGHLPASICGKRSAYSLSNRGASFCQHLPSTDHRGSASHCPRPCTDNPLHASLRRRKAQGVSRPRSELSGGLCNLPACYLVHCSGNRIGDKPDGIGNAFDAVACS